MHKFHNVDSSEAVRLVEVLSLDEAEKTVEEYNKKFGIQRGRFSNEKGKTRSVANGDATALRDQPDEHMLQTHNNSQTEDKKRNKKLKCAKCHFRSNERRCVLRHFKIKHRQYPFNSAQCVQVLDEDEAARTFAAYETNQKSISFACKPFKCGKCEYRAAQKSNAYSHMRRIHQVEFHEVKRLVKVLPLDEAKKTVKEYNIKFGQKSGRHRSYKL
jgi:DNA-directed RNA polymerase subunit H (RpoH/RPB5)